MAKLLREAAIGCALTLAGCQASPIVADAAKINPAAPAQVAKVQTTAVRVCGFEPTAATVVRLLGTVTGYGLFTDPATDIADRICTAVTKTASLGDGGTVFNASYAALKRRKAKAGDAPKGEVDGVPVKGRFVIPPKR